MRPVHHRRRALILAVCAVVVLLTFVGTAGASPISDKKAKLKAVIAKLGVVRTQAEVATEKYNQATSRLQTVRQQIAENEKLLKQAEYNLSIANDQLRARALDLYKSRDTGFMDALFSASSFDDLVTQMNLMQRLGNSDVDTMRAIAAYKRDVQDRRVKLEADRKAAAKLVAEAAAQKDRILSFQSQLQQMTVGLKSEIKKMEAAAALAAKLAAQRSWGGVAPPPYDPNMPGHPEIIAIAQRYLGVPYVWGGTSPSGFDCSGLVQYVFAQAGIQVPRVATDQQRASTPVPVSALKPGDLVFFGNASFSHHVGIYVGGGTMLNAPYTGAVVRYDSAGGAWIGGRF